MMENIKIITITTNLYHASKNYYFLCTIAFA